MAPAENKSATKAKSAKTAASASAETKERQDLLNMLSKGWREYNSAQINFAEQNTNAYFAAMRKVLEAKSLSDAMTIYGKFAQEAGQRQMEQARTLGKMAVETTRNLGAGAMQNLRARRGSGS